MKQNNIHHLKLMSLIMVLIMFALPCISHAYNSECAKVIKVTEQPPVPEPVWTPITLDKPHIGFASLTSIVTVTATLSEGVTGEIEWCVEDDRILKIEERETNEPGKSTVDIKWLPGMNDVKFYARLKDNPDVFVEGRATSFISISLDKPGIALSGEHPVVTVTATLPNDITGEIEWCASNDEKIRIRKRGTDEPGESTVDITWLSGTGKESFYARLKDNPDFYVEGSATFFLNAKDWPGEMPYSISTHLK